MVEVENKVQRYDMYKESGVEWLGEIPEHWTVGRLGSILNPVSSKNHPNETLLSITREKGVIVRDLENEDENHNYIPDDLTGYKLLKEGQFGMNKMKAWQGSYGVSSYTGIVSPAYYTFEFTKNIEPRFFHLAIRSKMYVSFFGKASDGVRIGQWDLSKDRMKRIPLAIPPLSEQTKIAQFLDDKTTKIEDAIAIKVKQINLLKERKQILIHKAVTRGLDDSLTLKDSGVEWIGEIPKGWLSISFRRISHLQQGLQIAIDKRLEEPTDDALEYITTKSIHNPNNPKHYVTKPNENVICDYQDVLLGRTGNTGEVVTNVRGVFHNNFFKIVYDKKRIERDFLVNYLKTQGIQKLIMLSAGVTTIPDLNHGDFLSLPFVLPPLSEQKEISAYIETASQKIETAIGLKQQEIEKLKEYKSSLINGVVTGKVKVC